MRHRIIARLPDNAASIRVEARGTEVTLNGEVDLLAKREIAREVAETVRGVTQVENRITVRAEQWPDGIMAVEVQNSLESEQVTATQDIDVSAEDGVVALRGLVDTVA